MHMSSNFFNFPELNFNILRDAETATQQTLHMLLLQNLNKQKRFNTILNRLNKIGVTFCLVDGLVACRLSNRAVRRHVICCI